MAGKKKSNRKKYMKPIIIGVVAMVLFVAAAAALILSDQENVNADADIVQYDMPNEGDTVAEIHIADYGVIKVRLFPEAAPKAVENFVTLAEEGYYDGVSFHRVVEDFIIQGGDPTGTGTGGESIWGDYFEDEFSLNLIPIRGSLCMANKNADDTNTSQFFFVVKDTYDLEAAVAIEGVVNSDLFEYYIENGGAAHLYGRHTVFGQIYQGIEVADEISKVETEGDNNTPVKDVMIEKIVITTYSK